MLKVLWLCSWYPNNVKNLEGNFIQQHAQAASLSNKIHVIKLTPDANAKAVTRVTKTFQQWPNLGETHVYYPKPQSFIGKTVSYFRWYSLYKYAIETFIEKYGKPDLVHVHVPYKAGGMARFIQRKYKVPYVVTDHWIGYNSSVENNYKQKELGFKTIVKDTLKAASGLHTTSNYLAVQINKLVHKVPYTVIPNAVNTEVFNYSQDSVRSEAFQLIHISNGATCKNVPGIIEAFNRLNKEKYAFTIAGLPAEQNELYKRMYPFISFTGEMAYGNMADHLKKANAFILFSNADNAPAVIGEALCCGLPVIATKVGGVPELVNDRNSILVEPANIDALAGAIEKLHETYLSIDQKQIATDAADKFSFSQISFETDLWYKSILMSQEAGE